MQQCKLSKIHISNGSKNNSPKFPELQWAYSACHAPATPPHASILQLKSCAQSTNKMCWTNELGPAVCAVESLQSITVYFSPPLIFFFEVFKQCISRTPGTAANRPPSLARYAGICPEAPPPFSVPSASANQISEAQKTHTLFSELQKTYEW